MAGEVALDIKSWEVVGRPPRDQGRCRALIRGESFGKAEMDKEKPAKTIMRRETFGKEVMVKAKYLVYFVL